MLDDLTLEVTETVRGSFGPLSPSPPRGDFCVRWNWTSRKPRSSKVPYARWSLEFRFVLLSRSKIDPARKEGPQLQKYSPLHRTETQ